MSQQLELVLASANLHKVAEIEEIFTSLMPECKLLARPGLNEVPDVDENADTLVGNAKLKALAIMNATQKPALADDTGLFVVALNGAPGVHSARFAGDEIRSDGSNRDAANRALLLQRLHGEPDRRAEFRSVMVVAWPNASGVTTWTIAEGVLAEDPYFAGDAFTIADIAMATALTMRRGALGAEVPPGMVPWLDRVLARPAYKRAVERAA